MKSILASSSFFIINKNLLYFVGLDASIVLSDLVQKRAYFKQTHQLNGGFFYNTSESISCSTSLSYYQIKQALSILQRNDFVEVKLKGIPAKNHFKIFDDKILKYLNTCNEKIVIQECENFKLNNNKEIRIKNNNKSSSRKERFLNDLKELEPRDYIEDFVDYWTEENNSGKQRWELEKTWNTSLRYKRWCRNQKNFSNGSSANNMPDFLDSAYLNRIREDQSQVNKFYKHLVDNCQYEKIETLTGHIKYRKKR
jgi:hypothetical protein